MKRSLFFAGFFLIAGLLFSGSSFARNPPAVPQAPVTTPIDGGLSILLAAGAGYGIKKIRDQRKKNQKDVQQVNG